MLTAAALAIALVSPPTFDAAEFFPILPGTKWVYQEDGKQSFGAFTDTVKPEVEIDGQMAVPIETRFDGKVVETVFYRLAPDGVYIVAYDVKKPLELARPAFKVGPGVTTWEYTGSTPVLGGPVPLTLKGSSQLVGKRKFRDAEVECLEVRIEAKVGPPDQRPITSKQTAIYAKGIGMIEMQEKSTVARKTEDHKVKLVEFVLGRP